MVGDRGVPSAITRRDARLIVDGTVELDDESALATVAVGDVGSEWVLAAEFQAVEASVANKLSDELLRWRSG